MADSDNKPESILKNKPVVWRRLESAFRNEQGIIMVSALPRVLEDLAHFRRMPRGRRRTLSGS